MIKPSEFANNLSYGTEPFSAEALEDYNPFVVNMILSTNISSIAAANYLNRRPDMDKIQQYMFLFHILNKTRRRFMWLKKNKIEDLELIQNYFQCNPNRAKDYLKLLTDDEVEEIRNYYYEGGRQ